MFGNYQISVSEKFADLQYYKGIIARKLNLSEEILASFELISLGVLLLLVTFIVTFSTTPIVILITLNTKHLTYCL